MANTFSNSKQRNIGTSETTVYTVGNVSGNRTIVVGCNVANTTANSVTADVSVFSSGGTQYYLVKGAPVPSGGSLEVTSGNKVVLNQNETLKVKSSAATSLDVLLSIMEIT
tara:strand:- start:68 stop:400 length:333 start_codon:yes stop_codon:yes gene_type:complete